jgi:uncharacterized protein YdeI (YjbR/CyaY-like superfamily)
MDSAIQPTYFATPADFRNWLTANHDKERALFVGFYKVGSDQASMSWGESVDQALCFGWIDGLRKSIDKDRYFIRFTPRKPKSTWSAVNIKKMETLSQQGLMLPPGLAVFQIRDEKRAKLYSYEKEEVSLPPAFEAQFRENEKAWDYFHAMPLSYRKPALNWVLNAKQEATRIKRLNELINDSEAGRKIKYLSY